MAVRPAIDPLDRGEWKHSSGRRVMKTALEDQTHVAQVAMQQGRYVGRAIARRVAGQATPRPFRYFDKGNMAVIGRNFAILETGRLRLSGLVAWLAWAAIHIAFLHQAENKLLVFTQWAWSYVTKQHGSRLNLEPRVTSVRASSTKT